jgi:protein TIF31
VKAVAEQLPKGNPTKEPSPQGSHETAATDVKSEGVTALKAVEVGKLQKPEGERQLPASEGMKSPVDQERETGGVLVATEKLEEIKFADEDHIDTEDGGAEIKVVTVKDTTAEAETISDLGHENLDTSKDSNTMSSPTEVPDTRASDGFPSACPDLKPQSTSIEKAGLLEKDSSSTNEKVEDENTPDLSNDNTNAKLLSTGGVKQDDAETGKEATKKLSAAAPPFNPSTIPVFSSVTVPGFKDHGLLPPPVNIPPMLTVNPVRRSPHQSATARVPYGPRLSGGYNKSGNRVPRNKPSFHNGEHTGDGNHFSPPRIMNPHAAEFVPCQPWVPNGYPLQHNGYMATTNGMPVSPNGYPISPTSIPVSPNGYPASLNGIEVTQNGFPASLVGSEETPTSVSVDVGGENKSEAAAENGTENSEIEVGVENHSSDYENQKYQEENVNPEIGEKPAEVAVTSDTVVAKETCDSLPTEEKPSKCWADYSDNEAEIVEVAS